MKESANNRRFTINRWDELLKNHEIHATLKELIELVNTDTVNTEADQEVEKRRLLKVILTFQDILEHLNSEMVSFNQLDSLNNNFKSNEVRGQILQYKERGELSFLRNANDNIGSLLSQLSSLLTLVKKLSYEKPVKGLEKLVDGFTTGFLDKKNEIDRDIKKLSVEIFNEHTKVNELIGIIETRRQETDASDGRHTKVPGGVA